MDRAIVKKLSDLSEEEKKSFIDSFDKILIDLDGVLWPFLLPPFPKTSAVLKKLREVGKKVYFVTNNNFKPFGYFEDKFNALDFRITTESLLNPVCSIVHYLKSINFTKKIFAVTSAVLKETLKTAGFEVLEPYEGNVELNKEEIDKHLVTDKDIGAVIIDYYMNLSAFGCLNSISLLKNPETLYIAGTTERFVSFINNVKFFGTGCILDLVNQCTNREAMIFSKPGNHFGDLVKQMCQIDNPKRALFVGDMLEQDMSFATISGFQKLLVLSGMTTFEELQNCEKEENLPDYYTDNIADLIPMLDIQKSILDDI